MDTLYMYRIYSNEHDRSYMAVAAHQHRHRPAPSPPRKRAGDDQFLGTAPAKKSGGYINIYAYMIS